MGRVTPPATNAHMPRVQVKRPGDRRNVSRSATRALDIMELFGKRRGSLRAVEIATTLGLHASTTNQLLKSLLDSGHLVFEARRKSYLPSARLVAFGQWIGGRFAPGARLHELIEELSAQTGQIVTLSTPNDIFMQIVDVVIPGGQKEFRGLQISLFGSAVGSAYLSTLNRDDILRLAYRARVPESEWLHLIEDANATRIRGFAMAGSGDANWSIALPLAMPALSAPTIVGMSGDPGELRDKSDELARAAQATIDRWVAQQTSQ